MIYSSFVLVLAINIAPGYHVQVGIDIQEHATTNSFKELDLETRECRELNEQPDPDSYFKIYTQKTCRFECQLRYSRRQCGCVPWNYPQNGADTESICYGLAHICFLEALHDTMALEVSPLI